MVEVSFIILCGCMVELLCLYCVAVWLKCPVCVLWLHGSSTLCILCGCMVEVSCLYSVAVWLRYPLLYCVDI